MRCMRIVAGIVVTIVLTVGLAAALVESPAITSQEALTRLKEGNLRFVSGTHKHAGVGLDAVRALAAGQKPYAIILTCSDSRVSPELLFDTGLGELFVVRVAGNVADPVVLGSIEYAAEHLGTPLVVVLGHERCGAVTAAVESKGQGDGNIGAIVQAIRPALKKTEEAGTVAGQDRERFVEAVADAHIALVRDSLTSQSKVLQHLVAAGKLKIVTAKYRIERGEVDILQ